MVFLKQEERQALSQRKAREEVKCPVCDGKAELSRNGDWTCIESKKQEGWGLPVTILTCASYGVSIGEELVPLARPHEDTSLSDAS